MKKGFNQGMHPSLIPDNYDLIYNVGVTGSQRDVLFMNKWKEIDSWKRGVIHQPILSTTFGVNENASFFLSLLNDLQFGSWYNKVPFIVDIFEGAGDKRYNLDHVRQHGIYITEKYRPVNIPQEQWVKPLLRVNLVTWKDWVDSNQTEAFRVLNDFELLLVQPGAGFPSELSKLGKPKWFEYDYGRYAFDETALWEKSPNPPVVVEPPVVVPPPVVVEPPVVVKPPVLESKPLKFKIKLFGITIGEIEEVSE